MTEAIRRVSTDELLIWNVRHLKAVLREHAAYCNEARTHQSLPRNSPEARDREQPSAAIRSSPVLGGLHYRYRNVARISLSMPTEFPGQTLRPEWRFLER